jgi:hypothetical protein
MIVVASLAVVVATQSQSESVADAGNADRVKRIEQQYHEIFDLHSYDACLRFKNHDDEVLFRKLEAKTAAVVRDQLKDGSNTALYIAAEMLKAQLDDLESQSDPDCLKPNASNQSHTKAAPGSSAMTECEGINNCATWTFLGKQGNGQWPSGETANLTVENLDGDNVVIHRSDSTGASAGLTATYRGTRHEDRIGGEFTSSWPGHWENKSGNWYATLQKLPQGLPPVMHMCNIVTGCSSGKGGTLVLEKGHYKNLTTAAGTSDIYSVETFTPESVVLRRTMSGTYNGVAVLTGEVSPQGNTVEHGTMKWVGSNQQAGFRIAWGTAIDTIPGSNPELERQAIALMPVIPVVCFTWFFAIVCN